MVVRKTFAPVIVSVLSAAGAAAHAAHRGHVADEGSVVLATPLPQDVEQLEAEWPEIGRPVADWSVGSVSTIGFDWLVEPRNG
jgi:hypothetical protein